MFLFFTNLTQVFPLLHADVSVPGLFEAMLKSRRDRVGRSVGHGRVPGPSACAVFGFRKEPMVIESTSLPPTYPAQ